MPPLKLEIIQEPPFFSLEEETLLNLLRTTDSLQRSLQLKTRSWGVTSTQYNVLRILRGAQPGGLTCSSIGKRMITAEPDITRLLNRLKAAELIQQKRDEADRRVLWTQITEKGLDILEKMEPMIERLPGEILGHMLDSDLIQLTSLLEEARQPHCATEA